MYVSTRVSLESFSLQNLKLKKMLDEGKVLEYFDPKSKLKDNRSEGNEINFEDYRIGSVKDVIQSILQFAQQRRKKTDSSLVGQTGSELLVVLDSWDSIAGMLDPLERKKTERALLTIAEANHIRLVFVSESSSAITDTDYMVDAIVELRDEALDDKRVRMLYWGKVRGHEIRQKASLYSLHSGDFTIFSPDVSGLSSAGPATSTFSSTPHSSTKYSTGSKDMDNLLLNGGIDRGSVVVLEIDPMVRIIRQWPMGLVLALNFIANGGCSVFIPPLHINPEIAKMSVAELLPASCNVDDSLRIIHDPRHNEKDKCFLPIDRNNFEASSRRIIEEIAALKLQRKEGGNDGTRVAGSRPCFYYFSIDAAESLFGLIEHYSTIQELERMVKSSGDVALLVLTSENEFERKAKTGSDFHLRITMLGGVPVVYSVKPPSTQFFHLGYDYCQGYPQVRLTPIA
jgi:KaiC/GvpD/RAD55 family RecA-like ATPase